MVYEYEVIEGLFELSTWEEDVKGAFGLQPPPGDWDQFKSHIEGLQSGCEIGQRVVVVYADGQAEHNKLYDLYDEPEEMIQLNHPILDPHLTPLGRSQASKLGSALQREIKGRGMPIPEKWFVSPLHRVGETCRLEWDWLFPDQHGVPAFVVENIREHLHVHLCDSRSTKSKLKTSFPTFIYPEEMSEEDTIWQPAEVRGRETEDELVDRCSRGIQECFERSQGLSYISVTAHSGAMRGIYKALGVKLRPLVVGEMNVLVIKVKEE